MQQIAQYDHQLNYVPFRYRCRSNTNPKKHHQHSYSNSYSRGKYQHHNPQKLAWDHRIQSPHQETPVLPIISKEQRLEHERDILNAIQQRREEKKEDDESVFVSQYHSEQSQSDEEDHQIASTNHQLEQSPIKQIQQREQQIGRAGIPYSNPDEDNIATPTETRKSSIFNESDVQEIKQIIINNIKQSEKHNQPHSNGLQAQPSPIRPQNNLQPQPHPSSQRLSFDLRYERLKAINQQYQQNYQFNRNLKRRQIIKKAKRMKQHQNQISNKLLMLNIDPHKLTISPIGHHQHGEQINIQAKPNNRIEKIQLEAIPITNKKINNHLQKQNLETQAANLEEKHLKQDVPNNNNSINTTNSSHVKQKEEAIKSNQVLTFDKYKQMNHAKKASIDKHPYHKPPPKNTHDRQSPYSSVKKVTAKQQPQNMQSHQQAQVETTFTSMLAQFTRQSSSKAIQELKQAKSKQKQPQEINLVSPGYAKQPPLSSYRSKQPPISQSYAVNMKKKKDKNSITASNIDHNRHPFATPKNLQKIQQEASIYDPSSQIQNYQTQRPRQIEAGQQIKHIYSPQPNIEIYFQTPFSQIKSKQRGEKCRIVQSDIDQMQEGITDCLKSERNRDKSHSHNSHHESSLPTSRVYERHYQQNKSEEGDELLKIMAVNTNFKELSSLVFQDRLQHQDLSLISQQLGQIINSNQSEFSATPTPHNVSLSSSSIHYNFDENSGQEGLENVLQISGRPIEEDSALIQINEDSTVFQQPIFPAELIITPHFFHDQINNDNAQCNLQRQESSHPSQLNPSSRRSIQAQADQTSIRDFRNHFHPNQAIRRFKHAKHNSADFQQKSLASARINHSQSTLRRNMFSLQSSQRVRSRLEKNKTRFKTRIN